MGAIDEFYEWLNSLQSAPVKARRGRKPKDKIYFSDVTQRAIIAYNNDDNQYLRDKIYREHIDYAINKLVENVYHTYGFQNGYFDVPYEDTKCEVVAFLNQKLHKFTAEKGKAYSYFTVIY